MRNHFPTALSFLTVFRLPRLTSDIVTAEDLAATFSFFPLVGIVLGGTILSVAYPLASFAPPLLLAVWITTLLAALTRALHLDGLADLADGIGGGYTKERRLEIMKDSRIGAFGAIALMLALLFKVSAICSLVSHNAWSPILLIPALSRTAMVLTAYKSPSARSGEGLGKLFLQHMNSKHLYTACGIALALSILLSPRFFLLYAALTVLTVLAIRRFTLKTLGGVTGDVLGATNELTEILLFSAAACLAS